MLPNLRLSTGLILALTCAATVAAPSVSSISGSIAEDQTIVIDGSSFGVNPMKVDWLGGSSGVIESRAASAPFLRSAVPGWSEDSSLDDSWVDTRRAYSGTKSLVFDPALARFSGARFGLIYDTGGNFPEVYSSYMVYFDHGAATNGQWKMVRYCYRNSVTDDAVPNAYMSNWEGGPGDFFQIHAGGTASTNNWFTNQVLPLSGAWYRVETYFRPSSQPSASDGEFWVRTTRTSDGSVQTERKTNLRTYQDGESNRYRYVVFQNYMGNGDYELRTKLWMDDIYVSQTQARVELCAASTWAACTKREIQPPVSWTGNRISVKLNKGGLANLAGTYLYVVDSTGAANANGIPLAGGGKVPAAPTEATVR